ncbi:MAG: hypothetical protein ACK4JE_03235 [Endomicrobiia bacterium]
MAVKKVSKKGNPLFKKKILTIDFPKENEIITSPHYTVRITSSENSLVELSINNGPWKPCRYDHDGSGNYYWWFDWSNYSKGPHKLIARIKNQKGKVVKKSEIRTCEIK